MICDLTRIHVCAVYIRLSTIVEIIDVEEAKRLLILLLFVQQYIVFYRLHKEALKQAATDPKTGIIDIGILATGVSTSERHRRETLAGEIKKLLQLKAKSGAVSVKFSSVFEAVREQSEIVSFFGLYCSISSTIFGCLKCCSLRLL